MNANKIGALIVSAAAFLASQNADAGAINFDVCLTNCQVLDVQPTDSITSLASLTFNDNGSGGVDFLFTNTIDDISVTQDRAFLSRIYLDTSILPASWSSDSISVDNILLDAGRFNIEQNVFDVRVDLARSGPSLLERVLAGGSASWTLDGISEADLSTNSIILVERIRSDNGFGGARIFGSAVDQQTQSVPEPGVLALLSLGLAGFGMRARKKLTGKGQSAG